jgi:hypothetical protein
VYRALLGLKVNIKKKVTNIEVAYLPWWDGKRSKESAEFSA